MCPLSITGAAAIDGGNTGGVHCGVQGIFQGGGFALFQKAKEK
jgi:hypothetical protein